MAPQPDAHQDSPPGTSQLVRPRAARSTRSRPLGQSGIRLRRFVCGIDLPLVQALHAGIEQRSADVVVDHRAIRSADRTSDDGRGCGGHRGTRAFPRHLGALTPEERMSRTNISDAADGEFLLTIGQIAVLHVFPPNSRRWHGRSETASSAGATLASCCHGQSEENGARHDLDNAWPAAHDERSARSRRCLSLRAASIVAPLPQLRAPNSGVGRRVGNP